MENFTYATVKGSSVDMYFRRQVIMMMMIIAMSDGCYHMVMMITTVCDEKPFSILETGTRISFF